MQKVAPDQTTNRSFPFSFPFCPSFAVTPFLFSSFSSSLPFLFLFHFFSIPFPFLFISFPVLLLFLSFSFPLPLSSSLPFLFLSSFFPFLFLFPIIFLSFPFSFSFFFSFSLSFSFSFLLPSLPCLFLQNHGYSSDRPPPKATPNFREPSEDNKFWQDLTYASNLLWRPHT